MTALAKLPEKWREEAKFDASTSEESGYKAALLDCIDELTAALSPAELGDPVTADNAKAADSAALAMIGMGYAWDGVHWYQATPRAAEAEWLPIESAPKDGSSFLVYLPDERRQIQVAWQNSNGVMAVGACFSFDLSPITHWRPLPAPPALTPPSAKGE